MVSQTFFSALADGLEGILGKTCGGGALSLAEIPEGRKGAQN